MGADTTWQGALVVEAPTPSRATFRAVGLVREALERLPELRDASIGRVELGVFAEE